MAGLARLADALVSAYPGLDRSWWPVDAAYHARNGTDPRFEVMVGAVLTQNTSWKGVERALSNLKGAGLMSPGAIRDADARTLAAEVRPAGTYNQKARYIRGLSWHVVEAYNGEIDGLLTRPTAALRRELLALAGIGPETADDILVYAAGRASFIIDAYTRRLAHRYCGKAPPAAYDAAQAAWRDAVGSDAQSHAALHAAIVEHAKAVCTARHPACTGCALRHGCASADAAQP